VDVALALLERRGREQRSDEAPRVALELRSLARRVAVTENEEVQLRRRIAALVERDQPSGVGRGRATLDELVGGIDGERPDVLEAVSRVALLQHDAHRPFG